MIRQCWNLKCVAMFACGQASSPDRNKSRRVGTPDGARTRWIPAFAGMTEGAGITVGAGITEGAGLTIGPRVIEGKLRPWLVLREL